VTTAEVEVIASRNTPPTADASATVGDVISPNNQDAEVLLDGSRSTDPEGDTLAYRWTEGPNELGTGPRVQLRLPVGRYEITLAVTDGQAGDEDAVTLRVTTAAEATRALIQLLEEANPPAARARAMAAILRAAERSFEGGQMNAGAHQLLAFQRLVRIHEGRELDPVSVARLMEVAQRIIDAVPHG
jgi:hypothetical protein